MIRFDLQHVHVAVLNDRKLPFHHLFESLTVEHYVFRGAFDHIDGESFFGQFAESFGRNVDERRTVTPFQRAFYHAAVFHVELKPFEDDRLVPCGIRPFEGLIFRRFVTGGETDAGKNGNLVAVAESIVARFDHARSAVDPQRDEIRAFEDRAHVGIYGVFFRADIDRFDLGKRFAVYFHVFVEPGFAGNVRARFDIAAHFLFEVDLHAVFVFIDGIVSDLHFFDRDRRISVAEVFFEHESVIAVSRLVSGVEAIGRVVRGREHKALGKADNVSLLPCPVSFVFQDLHDGVRCHVEESDGGKRLAVHGDLRDVLHRDGCRKRYLSGQIQVNEVARVSVPSETDLLTERRVAALRRYDGKREIARGNADRAARRSVYRKAFLEHDLVSDRPAERMSAFRQ